MDMLRFSEGLFGTLFVFVILMVIVDLSMGFGARHTNRIVCINEYNVSIPCPISYGGTPPPPDNYTVPGVNYSINLSSFNGVS